MGVNLSVGVHAEVNFQPSCSLEGQNPNCLFFHSSQEHSTSDTTFFSLLGCK